MIKLISFYNNLSVRDRGVLRRCESVTEIEQTAVYQRLKTQGRVNAALLLCFTAFKGRNIEASQKRLGSIIAGHYNRIGLIDGLLKSNDLDDLASSFFEVLRRVKSGVNWMELRELLTEQDQYDKNVYSSSKEKFRDFMRHYMSHPSVIEYLNKKQVGNG